MPRHHEYQRSSPAFCGVHCCTNAAACNSGFSLVELSIVLVILGFIFGCLLTGQSLIRASELRALTSEYERYVTATHIFREKYFAAPGDLRDATRFWGRQQNTADCLTNSGAAVVTAGVCDGNANNLIEASVGAGQSGERHQYWRHLVSAGLIEGSYTGLAGAGGFNHMIIGQNTPASKLRNTGWAAGGNYDNSGGGVAIDFFVNYGNFLMAAGPVTNNSLRTAILKPDEAWNIDTKVDDGKPGTGKLMALQFGTCTDAANGSVLTASYATTTNTIACFLILPRLF